MNANSAVSDRNLDPHIWEPISDLPGNWESIARPDIDRLRSIWKQEQESLKDKSRATRLIDRLSTRWAIETGIIERLYHLDRGITETLVDLGLDAIEMFSTTGSISRGVQKLIEDQRAALDFVFAYITEERPLTTSYIKELHQLLLRNQETTEAVTSQGNRIQTALIRGQWKKFPNNPLTQEGHIHEYCPPDFVQDEMERLIMWHNEHMASGVRPEVEAAWLHHRFTQIHPFQDGNGRVARALATMVFLKAGFLPLVIRNDEHRDAYIDALVSADSGDLSSLVSLFANIQSTDLNEAVTFVRELRGEGISALATAAAGAVKRRIEDDTQQLEAITKELIDVADRRLQEVSFELKQAFEDAGAHIETLIGTDDGSTEGWWRWQIVASARSYNYYADLSRFKHWIQLRLVVPDINAPRWHLVISFHHKETRAGLMAASAFLTNSDVTFEDEREILLGSQTEFTYSTARDPIEEFREWLDGAISRLLEYWQARL